jgi:hypothetical protein
MLYRWKLGETRETSKIQKYNFSSISNFSSGTRTWNSNGLLCPLLPS